MMALITGQHGAGRHALGGQLALGDQGLGRADGRRLKGLEVDGHGGAAGG